MLPSEMLESAIFNTLKEEPFLGSTLQCLSIRFSTQVPTAGVLFNKNSKKFMLLLNVDFMANLTSGERVAVMVHEMYHLLHRHIARFVGYPDHKRANIAMDMAINQLIKNLPKDGIFVENFRTKDKKPFPKRSTAEHYYDLLGDAEYDKNNTKEGKEEGKDGTKKPDWSEIPTEGHAEHNWGEGTEEDRMQALKDLMQRALEKTKENGYSISQATREMLSEIDAKASALDYKAMLNKAIRKSLPSLDRKATWKRPNKRYGYIAPGSKISDHCKINFYIDTSGSISITEANEALRTVDKFLKHGAPKCKLNMFHTELYYTKEYKLNAEVKKEDFEIGGTDLQPVITDICKTNPDLAIIITDGYYGEVMQKKLNTKVLFLISEGGTTDHPLKGLGETFKMKRGM